MKFDTNPTQLEEGALEGRWRDGMCSCCNHYPSCCHALFCGGVVLGQLWEKILGGPGACIIIFVILAVLAVLDGSVGSPRNSGGIEATVMFAFTFILYKAFIKRYKIPSIGNCQICCQVFWCLPCVLCRMMRHVHNYPESRKNPCCDFSNTGDKPAGGNCDCCSPDAPANPLWEKHDYAVVAQPSEKVHPV